MKKNKEWDDIVPKFRKSVRIMKVSTLLALLPLQVYRLQLIPRILNMTRVLYRFFSKIVKYRVRLQIKMANLLSGLMLS